VTTWDARQIHPRARVISDNDYGGDPDGLVQLAHLLLSPSVDVRCVIGSHLREQDPFDPSGASAARAAVAAAHIVDLCGRTGEVAVVAGSETPLRSRGLPVESTAARAIVAEAMRDDTDLPLFVTCGGGLTEIAGAWLLEPRIAERLTLVWIGGAEHPGVADRPPGAGDLEYNTAIDLVAAQIVFDDSDLAIWQVPRSTYRMAIASRAELLVRLAPSGALGAHLFSELARVASMAAEHGVHVGETYVLGDNPLVLLTALWTGFEPGPASSPSIVRPCPRIADSGSYATRPDGRPLRIFTGIDTRLMLDDLYAKLTLHTNATR
jgi:purine nucleosidase